MVYGHLGDNELGDMSKRQHPNIAAHSKIKKTSKNLKSINISIVNFVKHF